MTFVHNAARGPGAIRRRDATARSPRTFRRGASARRRPAAGSGVLLACLGVVLLLLAGCATPGGRRSVEPVTSRSFAELSAQEVAAVLAAVGLPDEEIVRVGPAFRNALATHGAARIRSRGSVEAIAMVVGDRLYVAAGERGPMVFDVGRSEPAR